MSLVMHAPMGDLTINNVHAVTRAEIAVMKKGVFVVVTMGSKKLSVNCATIGEAEKFLREVKSAVSGLQAYSDSASVY